MKADDLSENTEADVNYLQIIALGKGTVEMPFCCNVYIFRPAEDTEHCERRQ